MKMLSNLRIANAIGLGIVALVLLVAFLAGRWVEPQFSIRRVSLEIQEENGQLFYMEGEERLPIESFINDDEVAERAPSELDGMLVITERGEYEKLVVTRHWGVWSLLPALLALGLCLAIRDPMIAILMAVVAGALLLGKYDFTDSVLVPSLATDSSAGVLLLYLWLLGALIGIWSKSGAAATFAEWATKTLVRGPRTAKLVAWGLGVVFFQGGTISTVLVGAAVKPIADREKISHEELSYIVDSTASPIAILLAFNAWPIYVQTLLFVPGVEQLATESNRLSFFFSALPLSFYAWFAVLGTFLLSIDRAPFVGRKMRAAIKRARETGQLDREGAEPLMSAELQAKEIPEGYKASVLDFAIPLFVLTSIAVGTFFFLGSPQVRWAFSAAVILAALMALLKGMRFRDLMDGVGLGLKGVVVASVILLLAVTLGGITKEVGAADFMLQLVGGALPYWALPGILFVLTLVVAFTTGTSWGTYAVIFPLAMPLAYSIGQIAGLSNPELYLMVCFATVLNGSVFGDQCSPISDTTVLSATTCGADLMDHVLTQLPPAALAGTLAVIGWTALAFFCG